MKKRVTSQDVADLAGVSRTTVSFVLNDVKRFNITPETRRRVNEAAEKLGYIPNVSAQALASKRAKAIGLVMTRDPEYISSDSFLPKIIGGLLDIIKELKLSLLIEWVEPGHQLKTYRGLVHSKHIDGMILLTPRLDDEGLQELEGFDIPIVLMGTKENSELYSVDIDNRVSARQGVEYLLGLGHRKIACILNAPLPFSSSSQRFMGYQDALINAGIAIEKDLVYEADFTPESGYTCMQAMLNSGKEFSAVFVASDNVAMGAISAIKDFGLEIPGDISVLGFDDITWAKFANPALTTIHVAVHELVKQTCMLLIDLMKGQSSQPRHIVVDSHLVIRRSTQELRID